MGRCGVLMSKFAVLMGGGGVLLGIFMFAHRMVMLGLMMVVRGGMMMRSRRVMMFPCWV